MSAQTTQYGFYFDQSRCIGCDACVLACKSWNNIPAGPEKWLHVFQYEKGTFPNVRENILWVPCYQCQNPVCVDAANGAMYKEDKFGVVFIDPNKASSPGIRAAYQACPYGAISFKSDAPDAAASKCTMCYDRISVGKLPACVESCPLRALDFGKLSDLQAKYGTSTTLEDLPSAGTLQPAVIFKAKDPKKTLVPYDVAKAVQLIGQRINNLPPVLTSSSNLADISNVGRSSLNIKPKGTAALMEATRNDDA